MMDENIDLNKNTEINQALKEFETKSKIEQAQKTPVYENVSDIPKIVQLVMKWFGIKEQKQAEYVLLGFVILAIIVSLVLFFGTMHSSLPPPIDKIIRVAGPQGGN